MEEDRTCLVVGESLIDVVVGPAEGDVVERPGGSAANTAVALGRLGRPVRLATSYGADVHGRMLDAHLAVSGVSHAADPRTLSRTSVAMARVGEDGSATYDFDVEWRLAPVVEADDHAVHVCSLAPLLDPAAEEVLDLVEELAQGTTISYDLNLRPAITGAGPAVLDRVERVLAAAAIVKASDEDLAALWPDLDVDEGARHLLDLGAAAAVVTVGGRGARWHTRPAAGVDAHGWITPPPVEVVDTIGAGDTFAAGLLDALWEHLGPDGRERLAALGKDEWSDALRHAARCAAVTVSRAGADPPWRDELQEPDLRQPSA